MSTLGAGSGYVVRDAVEGDLGAVTRIEDTCFAFPWSYRGFRAELGAPDGCFLVAHDESGVVVGYLCGRRLAPHRACINNLAVHPNRRRSGVASALLRAACARWRETGVAWISLEVRCCNRAAVALYRAHGFVPIGVRRSFYPDGADALVMEVRLAPDPAGDSVDDATLVHSLMRS